MDKKYFDTVVTGHAEICECCGRSYGDDYGIKVFADNDLAPDGVKFIDGELYIGNKIVRGYAERCGYHKELAQQIPTLYTIRFFDGKYPRFVSGFDLMEEGLCYYNGLSNYNTQDGNGDNARCFDSVQEAFDHITSRMGHSDWEIHLEEPLSL